jgi:CysZ protein
MNTPAHSALRGFLYPFRAVWFLASHRRLLWLIALPSAINAALFVVGTWYLLTHLGEWLGRFLPQGDAWYWTSLFCLLTGAAALIALVGGLLALSLIGNIILGPFNEAISEKVEAVATGTLDATPFRIRTFLNDLLRSLRAEFAKGVFYLSGLLAIVALNLIPLIGTVLSGALLVPYTLFFLGWEFLDYSMERWKLTFRAKLKFAFANALVFCSFGAGASLLVFFPVVNLATIPLCAVGATLLACDLRKADS